MKIKLATEKVSAKELFPCLFPLSFPENTAWYFSQVNYPKHHAGQSCCELLPLYFDDSLQPDDFLLLVVERVLKKIKKTPEAARFMETQVR